MAYRYAQPDLFAHPESYWYAEAQSPALLDDWVAARAEAVQRIHSGAASVPEPTTDDGDGRPVLELLQEIADHQHRGDLDAAWNAIAPFVHKFEVFRRLWSHYTEQGRRTPSARQADVAAYLLLGDLLAHQAEAGGSLQALSTLLKLCDALCSLTASRFTADQAERLQRIVQRERALVHGLASSV